jgi:hypothetical protein
MATTTQPTEQQTVFDPVAGAKMLQAIDQIRRGYEAEAHRAYTLAQAGREWTVAYHNACHLALELLDSLEKNQSVYDLYEQITAPDVVVEICHDRTYDDWIPARAYGWQVLVDGQVAGYHYHAAPPPTAPPEPRSRPTTPRPASPTSTPLCSPARKDAHP